MNAIRKYTKDHYFFLLEAKSEVLRLLEKAKDLETRTYYTGMLQAYREEQIFLEVLLTMLGWEEK